MPVFAVEIWETWMGLRRGDPKERPGAGGGLHRDQGGLTGRFLLDIHDFCSCRHLFVGFMEHLGLRI